MLSAKRLWFVCSWNTQLSAAVSPAQLLPGEHSNLCSAGLLRHWLRQRGQRANACLFPVLTEYLQYGAAHVWVLRTQFERRGQANHKRRNLLQGTADGELEWHLLFSAIDSTLCHIVPFEVVQFPRLSLLKMTDVQTPRTKGSKKWFESDSVLAALGDRLEEEVLNPAGKNWCLTMTMTMMQ